MNHFAPNWPGALAALALSFVLPAVLPVVLPVELSAGEAIQFSNARNRQDPTAKSKLPGDKEGERLGRLSPLDYLPSGVESTRRDPAKERKAKNAAAERANWMMLDRGQLDAEDEEKRAFGIRDATFEKESDRKDYFFTPVNSKGDLPGRPRSPFSRASSRDRAEPDTEANELPGIGDKPEGNTEPRRTQVLGKDGQPLGEHTAKELDLKDFLNTSKGNSLAPAGDRTALLWKEVLGSSGNSGDAAPGRRREDPSTADSFRGSVPTAASRPVDSFALRNDFNGRAAVPLPPSVAGPAPRSFSLPTAPPIAPRPADPGFGRNAGLYGSPAGSGGLPAGNPGLDPNPGSRSQPPRSSSGNYQIPSRPGYGTR